MNDYDIEVKERFGETEAYKEYEQKTADYTNDKWQEINDGLMAVFAKFAECKMTATPSNQKRHKHL